MMQGDVGDEHRLPRKPGQDTPLRGHGRGPRLATAWVVLLLHPHGRAERALHQTVAELDTRGMVDVHSEVATLLAAVADDALRALEEAPAHEPDVIAADCEQRALQEIDSSSVSLTRS